MSTIWFEAALDEGRSESAWELYHENSRRSRSGGIPGRRSPPVPAPSYDDFPVFSLGEALPSPTAAPATDGAIALPALSALLAGCRPPAEGDPVEAFVHARAVETLPAALYWHDPGAGLLRLLRRDVAGEVERALVAPEKLRRCGALIFLAAHLDAAAARAGERGYRDALIATGRRLAAVGTAASAAGLHAREVAFYDRDVDAFLFLDGLARSVLAIVAVGPAEG